jgi:hypothetical protein
LPFREGWEVIDHLCVLVNVAVYVWACGGNVGIVENTVVQLVLSMPLKLLFIAMPILSLHVACYAVDGTRGAKVAVVLRTPTELGFLLLTVTSIEVSTNIAARPGLVEIDVEVTPIAIDADVATKVGLGSTSSAIGCKGG